MKKLIKNDIFNISKRIKQLNNNFLIFFNIVKNKYEIYENAQLVFSLPFNNLDSRTLLYVRKMLKTTNEEILKEIENDNKVLEKETNQKIISDCIESAERVLRRR